MTDGSALRAATSQRTVAVVLGALLAAAVVTAVVGGPPGAAALDGDRTLVVTHENGTELVAVPVDDDTEIVIEYTHSVEKTLVRDVYEPANGTLRMTRMEFSSFGAGLPAHADVTERDGRYVYYPLQTEYEALHVKTGTVADHDLIVSGDRYDITALSGGRAVELTVERRGPVAW